jgi:glycogen(starch) synthase
MLYLSDTTGFEPSLWGWSWIKSYDAPFKDKKIMRIALISYEFAGVGAGGGIGTYVRNAAKMLAANGHDVEVFCGNEAGARSVATNGFLVHSIACTRASFANEVRRPFAERHEMSKFDVIEGPEYAAEASGVARDYPDVPLVIRLHTPSFIIDEINVSYISLASKARYMLGGLLRGKVPKTYWSLSGSSIDAEGRHTQHADRVAAPSLAILDVVSRRWNIPTERADIVPNVFEPPEALLALKPATLSKTVLFLGKLEVRKGVLELAKAVPIIAKAVPDVKFVFIGRDLPLPGSSRSTVGDQMRKMYGRWSGHVTHLDAVDYSDVPALLEGARIAVFPSIWESFGYVCLEAMSAARAVVASSAGGMAEIIDHERTGLLVPPRDPNAIAHEIIRLLRDPDLTETLGIAAREHVVKTYGAPAIYPKQLASYAAAISAKASQEHGSRTEKE